MVGIMASIVLMIFFLQKLVIACKSNIRETINNVQSNNALKEDLSALLENHSMNNTLMVLIVLTAMLIVAVCCYGCTRHIMSAFRRSLAIENAAHYRANSDKEVKFTIPN